MLYLYFHDFRTYSNVVTQKVNSSVNSQSFTQKPAQNETQGDDIYGDNVDDVREVIFSK